MEAGLFIFKPFFWKAFRIPAISRVTFLFITDLYYLTSRRWLIHIPTINSHSSIMKDPDPIQWQDFNKIDLRIGTIIEANDFREAREPAYILRVDFGNDIGIKKSSAQITDHYSKEELIGKQIVAVVNFPPKQIGPIMSECLITGFYRSGSEVVLAVPDHPVPNGARLR